MYQAHFGLKTNPFRSSPSPEFIYESKEHREALAHFRYALENREAFLLLTGEVGTGKTTAVQAVRRLLPAGTPVAVVTHSTLEPRELIEEIALRFGLEPVPGESKPALMQRLEKFLEDRRRGGGHALVILDEAHLLSPELLEEVRLLSNLESESGGKLLQICLVGQPELLTHLEQPGLRQLRQRISVRYTLNPLPREETAAYIYHRLMAAGCDHPALVFPPEATDAVYALTQGIPREINVLASQALLNAYLEEAKAVSRSHVLSAKSDYGFEGIVTGPAALSPEAPPEPLPPRRTEAERPREAAGPSRPEPRPIPLPPRSLRPEPPPGTEAAESGEGEPAREEKVPAARLTPGPGMVGGGAGTGGEGGGRRRVIWIAVGVVAILLAGWWVETGRDRRPLSPEEFAETLPAVTAPSTRGTELEERMDTGSPSVKEPARPSEGEAPKTVTGTGAETSSEPGQETPAEPPAQKTPVPESRGGPEPPSEGGEPAAVPGTGQTPLLAVQVASFRTERKAREVLADVTRRTGLPGAVLPAQVRGELWYRILLGAFTTQREAEEAAVPLVRRRIMDEIVVRKIPARWVPVLTGRSAGE